MVDNNKTYEELESLIDYDIYQYSSNPNMPCDEVNLAGYIAANLTTRGYCKVNEEQVRKDTVKEILQEYSQQLIDEFKESGENQCNTTVAKVLKLVCPEKVNKIMKKCAKKHGIEVDDE